MNFLITNIGQLNDLLVYKFFGMPFILMWLVATSIFLSIKMRFINLRFFVDAIKTIVYVDPDAKKYNDKRVQISPFTAFATQAAGNLGLGNIAGAAFAVKMAGPGVLFWIFISSFFFSIIKFCEITLGHKYRIVNENGVISGGTFYFIRDGFANKIFYGISLKKLGIYLGMISAVITAIVVCSWSFFQLNQIVAIITDGKNAFSKTGVDYEVISCSVIVIFLAGAVLIGGIKRLGSLADMVVPVMAGGYLIVCSYVIFFYKHNIVSSLALIINQAFSTNSIFGGCCVTMVIAMQRMMFATEAGAGTAAMVHANSSLKRSSRQGLVAIIDCVLIATIICFGGFTILVSGVDFVGTHNSGIMLMNQVFVSVNPLFHYVLIVIAFLFGFTTITGNGYSVQKSVGYIFGTKREKLYLYIFIVITFLMSFYESSFLVKLFDVLTMLMLIPNTIGLFVLSSEVKKDLDEYIKEKKIFYSHN